MSGSKKDNLLHENQPWLIKNLYNIADPNTPDGARWHNKFAKKLFIAVGVIVALSFIIFGLIL